MPNSIRQQIVDAIEARMTGILTASGYLTNLGQKVTVWKATDWDAAQLPGLDIRDVTDEIIPGGAENAPRVPLQKEHHRLTVVITIAVASGTSTIADVRKGIADVYKAIGVDMRWTVSGTKLAFNTSLVKDELALDQENKILGGARVTFTVDYRTARFDPMTLNN